MRPACTSLRIRTCASRWKVAGLTLLACDQRTASNPRLCDSECSGSDSQMRRFESRHQSWRMPILTIPHSDDRMEDLEREVPHGEDDDDGDQA